MTSRFYSTETDIGSNPSTSTAHRWAFIYQNLDFYIDGTDTNGSDIYQPSLYFECGIYDPEHGKQHYSYDGENYYVDDGFHYTVNWYVCIEGNISTAV